MNLFYTSKIEIKKNNLKIQIQVLSTLSIILDLIFKKKCGAPFPIPQLLTLLSAVGRKTNMTALL